MSMSSQRTSHVVFFSRGKGRGHAIPDSAIAEALRILEPAVEISFVSYSLGASTLRGLGWKTTDLELPENNALWDTVVAIVRILQILKPTLVVSHEEFAAVPVAKGLGLPVVFLTDWFVEAESLPMQCLKHGDEIIFLDDPGYQEVPPYLANKVVYAGPVLRRRAEDNQSREACRAGLALPIESTVFLILPGGAAIHSEALAPICDVVLEAFDSFSAQEKRLIWVAGGSDHEKITKAAAGRQDVMVMRPHDAIGQTMRASDLVITKGNRISTLECEALGIPSISLSFGNNPVDDNRVARIRTNTALKARGLTKGLLAREIDRALSQIVGVAVPDKVIASRSVMVASRLRHYLTRDGPGARS